MKFINTAIAVIAIGIVAIVYNQFSHGVSFGGGSTIKSQNCDVYTVSSVEVGPNTSNGIATVLSAYSGRAWARIEARATSTPVYSLSFDEGAAAVDGEGLEIASGYGTGAGASSTPSYIDFGLNTDFPYTGAVTAINDSAASSSVLVTECRY